MRGDLDVIKQGLLDRVEDVCRELLPEGRLEGGRARWMAHDPVAQDYDRDPALSVPLTGPNTGRWKNFRGTATPAKHDMLGLVMYVVQTDAKGAMAWSRDFLGLRALSPGEIKQRKVEADRRRAQRDAEAARQRAKKIDDAQRRFAAAETPMLVNGDTHGHAYFAARKVPLIDPLVVAPETFRFCRAVEWWRGAKWHDRRKMEDGPVFPAIATAMRSPDGVLTAVHYTWLDPLTAAKAPVDPPHYAKMMRGEAAGAVMELTLGEAAKPFYGCDTPCPLILCEGIETGLALAHAMPEMRVWAGGSITNMGNAPVHLPCVSEVYLARDNNAGNTQAQKQSDASIEKLMAANKPLDVMSSHVGDDFNDLM